MRFASPVRHAVVIAACGIAASSEMLCQMSSGPPIRALGTVTSRSTVTFQGIQHIAVLSDGRVVVNDRYGRSLTLLDASLGHPRAVLDSGGGVAKAYPGRAGGGLIACVADTTIFVDGDASAMIVIDPQGMPGRIMALPPTARLATQLMLTPTEGVPIISARLGLVMRGPSVIVSRAALPARAGTRVDIDGVVTLVRVNMTTRIVDTITTLATGDNTTLEYDAAGVPTALRTSASRGGTTVGLPPWRPITFRDAWAVLSDGSVAVLREREYRVEWFDSNGRLVSSLKLPYDWRPLDDAAKRRIVDSVNAERRGEDVYQEAHRDSLRRRLIPNPSNLPTMSLPERSLADASAIPDFLPPTYHGARAAQGDLDGNVWFRVASRPGVTGAVYDVVNPRTGIVARIRIPDGRTLLGFGPGHAVLMSVVENGRSILERATW